MPGVNEQGLSESDQHQLAEYLLGSQMFGIAEDPADYIEVISGRFSPHYFDARVGVSQPETLDFVATTMADLVLRKTGVWDPTKLKNCYDHVLGTPEAFTSYTAAMALKYKLSLLQPRVDTAKKRGNKSNIIGNVVHDAEVAAFDDVITDGVSKLELIKRVEEQGVSVVDYYVMLDREEGGAEKVWLETGTLVTPAIRLSRIVEILLSSSKISQTQYDNVVEYISQYGDINSKRNFELAS